MYTFHCTFPGVYVPKRLSKKELFAFSLFSFFPFQWEYCEGVQVFNSASQRESVCIKVIPPYALAPPQRASSSTSLLDPSSIGQLLVSSGSSSSLHPPSPSSSTARSLKSASKRDTHSRPAALHSRGGSIEAFDPEKHFLACVDSPLVYYDFPFLRLAKPVSADASSSSSAFPFTGLSSASTKGGCCRVHVGAAVRDLKDSS